MAHPDTERPDALDGHTHRIKTSCGSMFTTVNLQDGKPIEVFIRMGKQGCCWATFNESLGRLLSIGLQYNVPLDVLIKQLSGLQCSANTAYAGGKPVRSCSDAIAHVLSKYVKEDKEK